MTLPQICLPIVLLLATNACGPGPTLYLGAAPALDGSAGAGSPPHDGTPPRPKDAGQAPPRAGEPPRPDDASAGGDGDLDEDDDDDGELDEDDDLPDAMGSACSGDAECATPARPHCQPERRRCVACRRDLDCGAREHCDLDEGECEEPEGS